MGTNKTRPPRIRDNAGRFRKYAAAYIDKELRRHAEEIGLSVRRMVKDKLKETYKDNVKKSYTPRSVRGQAIKKYNESTGKGGHKKKLTYRHTGTFLRSINTVIEGNVVKVKIDDLPYPKGRTTTKVYKWLREGTKGSPPGKGYPYLGENAKVLWAYNYPTPAHLFEQHTRTQMKGYLAALKGEFRNGDIMVLHKKYAKYKRKTN